MRRIAGDLLDPDNGFEAIGHGVNLRGVMGAGIAKSISTKWPDILHPYRLACGGERLKLGGIQAYQPIVTPSPLVYNLATQVNPGPNADLNAIWSATSLALIDCYERGIAELALPQVGCGIGGLNWHEVNYVFHQLDSVSPVKIVVVVYDPPKGN